MPSASKIQDQSKPAVKDHIRCHARTTKWGREEKCGRLLTQTGQIRCRCGQEHSLTALAVLATNGSFDEYIELQRAIKCEYWQLRTGFVSEAFYRGRRRPLFFQPNIPDWILSRIDLIEHEGLRPAFIPGQANGSWILFELDPFKNWNDWGRIGDRNLPLAQVDELRDTLSERYGIPTDWITVPDHPNTWNTIRTWRNFWSDTNSSKNLQTDWETELHWISDGSGRSPVIYAVKPQGVLLQQSPGRYSTARAELMIIPKEK